MENTQLGGNVLKKYEKNGVSELIEVRCNKCGKNLVVENGIVKEEYFSEKYQLGYFGERDGEIHSFDLCELCYNQIIKDFVIPITIEEAVEFI